ncbi:MAG: hypothetical protein KJ017_00855 [Alphaproteobacteria bacterium]|nr:hypothetical protein [Alphaproteobacteria bacterium]
MYKTTLLAGFSALALVFTLFPAHAEEGGTSVSYAKKKQGGVHFVNKDKIQDEAANAADPANPQDVEPAAGTEEEPEAEENRAADMIKLPRK